MLPVSGVRFLRLRIMLSKQGFDVGAAAVIDHLARDPIGRKSSHWQRLAHRDARGHRHHHRLVRPEERRHHLLLLGGRQGRCRSRQGAVRVFRYCCKSDASALSRSGDRFSKGTRASSGLVCLAASPTISTSLVTASRSSSSLSSESPCAVHNCFGCDQYKGLVLPTDREPPPTVTDTLLLVEPSRAKAQRQREIDNLGDVETPDGHEQEGEPSPEPDVPLGRDRPKTDISERGHSMLSAAPRTSARSTPRCYNTSPRRPGGTPFPDRDRNTRARRVRRQQDSDNVRERDDAEVRPEQLRDRLIQRRRTADGGVR
jgi:hypothetical protein